MTLSRRTPLRPRYSVDKRDCQNCGRRVQRTDGGPWHHVRDRACQDPKPFATKRTPSKRSQNRRKDAELRRAVGVL